MAGAPSHLDLFDYKPELAKQNGKLPPAELLKGYRAAFINPSSNLLGPKFQFARHGRCGAELSELLPRLAEVVDDICLVKSMNTDAVNHAPAQILMNTGSQQFGRPARRVTLRVGRLRDLPATSSSAPPDGTSGGASSWGASCRRSTGAFRSGERRSVLYPPTASFDARASARLTFSG